MNEPIVSVCCITYNHVKYVKDALEGILMQKTNFLYEVCIGEDDSDDGTKEICIEYAQKHPTKIRLFLRSRNDVIHINSQATGRYNFLETLKECRGKYIAHCDGDDYWTDPYKLQKQVDFLETNPDCVICHPNVQMISDNSGEKEFYNKFNSAKIYTQNDLLKENTIVTSSMMFRNCEIVQNWPPWSINCPIGDVVLTALLTQHGNIGYIDEVMAVYRRHPRGIHAGKPRIQNYLDGIQSRLILGENTGLIKNPNLRWVLSNLYKNASSEFEKLEDLLNAKKYAFRRFKYSQHDQIKLSMKRLFMIYGRYYRKKYHLFFN